MVFLWSFPPATTDLPVYKALRADLAASGDEALQPENLKASPMRSWIGLYALLKMIRDAKMTTFTRDGHHHDAEAGEGRPDARHVRRRELDAEPRTIPGIFKRAGTNHWAIYRWDPNAKTPDGSKGNFVEKPKISFDEVLCGSPSVRRRAVLIG